MTGAWVNSASLVTPSRTQAGASLAATWHNLRTHAGQPSVNEQVVGSWLCSGIENNPIPQALGRTQQEGSAYLRISPQQPVLMLQRV